MGELLQLFCRCHFIAVDPLIYTCGHSGLAETELVQRAVIYNWKTICCCIVFRIKTRARRCLLYLNSRLSIFSAALLVFIENLLQSTASLHRGNLHQIIRVAKTIYRRIDASSVKHLIVLRCNAILEGLEHFLSLLITQQQNKKFFTHVSGSDWL